MVSSFGRIKSLKRFRVIKDRILVQNPDRYGHTFVSMYDNGEEGKFYVHKIVALVFMGHRTDGTTKLVIDHIDEDKSNNSTSNLQIITHKENIQKYHKLKKDESIK